MLNLSLSSSSTGGLTIQNPSSNNTLLSNLQFHTLSSKTCFWRNPSNPASFSTSKNTKSKDLYLKCRHSDYFEHQQQQQQPHQRFSSVDSPFSSQQGTLPSRIYVGYSIYKGKAALQVEPRPPEFLPLDSGAFKLSKEGFVFLQFAPAAGVRQYDWSRKQVFSLSVTEMGNLISLGVRDSCEFFHDPFKGRSDEGKVRKVLKVEPLPDGSGHFFNLSVQNKLINMDDNIYIPVTKAEFTVLTSTLNFIVPYLLGWHTFASSMKPEDLSRVNNVNPRSSPELEWNR